MDIFTLGQSPNETELSYIDMQNNGRQLLIIIKNYGHAICICI